MTARVWVVPLVLATVGVGVGFYAVVGERGTHTTIAGGEATRLELLPGLVPEDVEGIEITVAGDTLRMARPSGGDGGTREFELLVANRRRAATATVEALLRTMAGAKVLRAVHKPADIGPTRAAVTLLMAGTRLQLELHGSSPYPARSAYVVRSGATVVVSGDVADALGRSLAEYRDPRLVSGVLEELARVEVTGPDASFAVVRSAGAAWALPSHHRASRSQVEMLFGAALSLAADRYLSADAPLGERLEALSFGFAEGAVQRLDFYSGCPGAPGNVTVVRHDGDRACIADIPSALRRRAVAEFEDRRLFDMNADEISEIVLETKPRGAEGASRLELVRSAAGFRERAPTDRLLDAAENAAVMAYLGRLAELRGEETVTPTGSRGSMSTVVLRGVGGREETVDVSEEEGRAGALVRRVDGVTLRTPPSAKLELAPREFARHGHEGAPLDVVPEAVTAFTLSCGGSNQRIERTTRGWRMHQPVDSAADEVRVDSLLDELAKVRAAAWLSLATPFRPACALTWIQAGDAGSTAERFEWDVADGVAYGRVGSAGAPFELRTPLPPELTELLVDRSASEIDLSSDQQIEISHAGRTQTWLVRRGTVSAAGAPSGAGRERMATALSAIAADAVLHVGPPRREDGVDVPLLRMRARPASGGRARALAVGSRVRYREDDGYALFAEGVPAVFFVRAKAIDDLVSLFLTPPSERESP